jgi:hypothetical protein
MVHSIDKVHVGNSRRSEHDRVALGTAESSVRGEIILSDVGLYFDNSAATRIRTTASHQERTQQPSGCHLGFEP